MTARELDLASDLVVYAARLVRAVRRDLELPAGEDLRMERRAIQRDAGLTGQQAEELFVE